MVDEIFLTTDMINFVVQRSAMTGLSLGRQGGALPRSITSIYRAYIEQGYRWYPVLCRPKLCPLRRQPDGPVLIDAHDTGENDTPKDENSMKNDADRNDETSPADEPAWLDPANDRKTPYTEKELELFVDGAISSMYDVEAWNNLVTEHGEKKAREILKEGFRKMDERNLINMKTKGPPQ